MNTKIYNKQLIEEFHSYNYFGCLSTGQSEEQQEELKRVWIDNMENRGWILDESIIYHDRSRKSTKIYKFEFQSLSIPLSAVRLSTLVLMD